MPTELSVRDSRPDRAGGVPLHVGSERSRLGFTLIELLITAAIVVIAITAVAALLAQTTTAYRVNEESSRRQQEIEAAVQILSYDLGLAGYRGTDLASLTRTFGVSSTVEVRIGEASDDESDLLIVRYFEDDARAYGADSACGASFCTVTYDVDFDEEIGSLVLYRIASQSGGLADVRGIVQAVDEFIVVGVLLRSGEVAPVGATLPESMAGLYIEITFENGGAWRFPVGIGNRQALQGSGG